MLLMTENSSDILEDISDEDLPQLAKMYEKHKEWAPHAYSTITTAIEWKKKSKENYLTVMSPNSCWREDGTFFVFIQYYCSNVFIFSLDKTGKNIYKALAETKRLEGLNGFYSIHEIFCPIIRQFIAERHLKIQETHTSYMLSISGRDASEYTIEFPPDVYIKKLDKSYAPVLNEKWPHKFENSEKYVALLLEMNDGYGIFLKSNNELVCWIVLSVMGQLGILQTKEEHKKKGYGSLITKYMSKRLAKMGHNPFGTIVVENTASVKMFQKLGFKSIGLATYIYTK